MIRSELDALPCLRLVEVYQASLWAIVSNRDGNEHDRLMAEKHAIALAMRRRADRMRRERWGRRGLT